MTDYYFITTTDGGKGKKFLASVDMDALADKKRPLFGAVLSDFDWSDTQGGAIHFVPDDAPEGIFDLFAFTAQLEDATGQKVSTEEIQAQQSFPPSKAGA